MIKLVRESSSLPLPPFPELGEDEVLLSDPVADAISADAES